jgi:hypothetical protein
MKPILLFLVGTDVAGLFLSDFEFLFFNDEEGLND